MPIDTHPGTRSEARRQQRGAAALAVTLLLCVAMLLSAAFANRNLLFEQRSSANQYRSAKAFEAAEAGLEWAVSQLNSGQRVGADCAPSTDPADGSFRARHLEFSSTSGAIAPRTWHRAGITTPLRPSCVLGASGWACSCPAGADPALGAPTGDVAAPAFAIEFLASATAGAVRVVATGCTQLAGACVTGSSTRADATARVELLLALVGALRSAPAATATTRGDFDAGSAAIGLHNPDPAGGVVVNAGGVITAGGARLTPPAGASRADLLLGGDTALAALDAERFFVAHFGIGRAHWPQQAGVVRIDCAFDCSAAVVAAAAAAADSALIHVEGDLHLRGPLVLGSLARPVVLVVSGALQLEGAVALTGLLHAGSLAWDGAAGGAFVRGALLSETGYRGSGTPTLDHDRQVLDTLRHAAGTFTRVAGSWRDF